MVVCPYGALDYWSVSQSPVDDRLAFLVLSCPIVGGPAVISNVQSILVKHVFPEHSIRPQVPHEVPSFAVGVEVSREGSAALPNDSFPVQLWCRSLSLS